MELKLEDLKYQDEAIESIINVFDKTEKNTFDNACFDEIRSNICKLSKVEILNNIKKVVAENGVHEDIASITDSNDLCVEMETGTGKTLVYLKTIYKLYREYGFKKFIILVPSVAISQGVLTTFNAFSRQLEEIYNFKPNAFEYDSKKLSKVTNYIEDQHPQIMIMTLASFNSEDKILNQAQREDLFSNMPFILPENLQVSGLVKIYLSVARKYVQSEEVFQLEGCLIRDFEPKTAMGGDVIKVIAENHSPDITGNKLYIGAVQTTITNIISDTIYSYVPSSAMYGDNSVKLTSNGKTTFALENIRVINPWSNIVNPETFYRNGAVGYARADFLFVGLGQNTNENYTYTAYHDLWKYDLNSNNWTQCADMPAVERQDGVGFSVAGKGYVCLGHRGGWDFYIDLYAYDPQSDSWEKKADFPGEPWRYSMAVTIGDIAYVGFGLPTISKLDVLNDFWRYDSEKDFWARVPNCLYEPRYHAISFVADDKAYIVSGNNEDQSYGNHEETFIIFNPDTDNSN